MPYKHITQEEARDYRKRAENAEQKLRNWTYDAPGVHVQTETGISEGAMIRLKLARKLGYGLTVTPRQDTNVLDIYAVKP